MRRLIVCVFTVFLLTSFKESENLKWLTLNEGLELSRKEKKPVFIFMYVSWCDKCQRMEKKVFSDKEISTLISGNFIPVKLSPEVDSAFFRSDKVLDRKIFLSEIEPGKMAVMVPTTVLYREADSSRVVMNGLVDKSELKEKISRFLEK
jgi:thioredoxin-related protein